MSRRDPTGGAFKGARYAWFLVAAAMLVGCTRSTGGPEPVATSPDLATDLPVTARPVASTPTSVLRQDCADDAIFVDDLTLPDGSLVAPGSSLDKRWQVRNSGSCDWNAGYALAPLPGNPFGEDELALYPARAGAEATWTVALQAPLVPGEYLGQWQAVNPEGQPFGQAVFLLIEVGAEPTTTSPVSTSSP